MFTFPGSIQKIDVGTMAPLAAVNHPMHKIKRRTAQVELRLKDSLPN